ncbi:hypothetical protein F2Q68_00017162 [Brassica cretica]|uniref:Putative plant transposon protein domain-containing protein n=1 Tax=Brassica cretica TaxID=69181 RepID=A0A8S9HAS1_BRACR|nr:hypothetical protein F2Q68_00017162 [Brassica cretica]
MADQNLSSSVRTRIRSRLIFSGTVSPIGGYSRRHHSHEATIGYRSLCLRGFVVQGYLDPRNRLLEDVFRVIDNIGWCYMVLHVNPFCPRVVREFISNKPFNEDGALIRGFVYRFSPLVINQLMMTPTVEHSFQWKDVVLKQEFTHLTGGQCSGWTGFNLNALLNPFQVLYHVCERNWLPGPDSDLMIKKRHRLLYAVAKRKEIDFGQLVYEQVIDMTRVTDLDTSLIFPNLIYQLLVLQKEVPLLPGDEEPIGRRYLDLRNHLLEDVFRVIDNIGWCYTVLHLNPLCPRVVREFISNKPFNEDGALIRGFVYRFSPSVINQLMMTPTVEHSFQWKDVVLKQAITHLTGGQCSGWTGFNLNALLNPFQVLYHLLVLQKEVPLLPGDEEPIGRGLPIYDSGSDGSGPRGR